MSKLYICVMILYPNAKINLGLSVVSKRPDGYHELATLMYPIPVFDILEITKSDHFTFLQTGLTVDGNQDDNLCVKTYKLLESRFNIQPLAIHLRKQIPMGAGLGGGSSDVAFLIKGINQLLELNLSITEMQLISSELGSDCAFFIENNPQFAKGRGEILSPFSIDLSNYWIKIINPGIHISTKMAFENVYKSGFTGLKNILMQPISSWKNDLKNDFEKHIFELFPIIHTIKNKLYSEGAIYASMTGSGSTVYAIYDHEPRQRTCSQSLEIVKKIV